MLAARFSEPAMNKLLVVALMTLHYSHWDTDFLSFYAGAKLAGTSQLYSFDAVRILNGAPFAILKRIANGKRLRYTPTSGPRSTPCC